MNKNPKATGQMNLKKAIVQRRSERVFSDKVIHEQDILDLIDIARWAPSNCNTQESKFIIIEKDSLKQKIIDRGGSAIIKNAKQGILVLYNNRSDNVEYKDHIQSAAAAIQNLCLYAHSKGIGTCWVCHLPRKKILRKLLEIPPDYDPVAYILIGYPLKEPINQPRKYSVEEIVSYNTFDFKVERNTPVLAKLILRKIYYLMPVSIKRKINHFIDKKFVKKFTN